jgi:hypothetical protein
VTVLHEIRNHLAVAIANVEGFRDGLFEPSPKRLTTVLTALGEVDALLGSCADDPRDDLGPRIAAPRTRAS